MRNNRGTGVIEALLLLAEFAFVCWITEAKFEPLKDDPPKVEWIGR